MNDFWHHLFSRHGFKLVCGLIGLLIGILFVSIGFWRTLLILTLLVVGLIIGYSLDRRQSFLAFIQQMFKKDDSDR
nr:DUF2273 domain-containing protein [bacterium]